MSPPLYIYCSLLLWSWKGVGLNIWSANRAGESVAKYIRQPSPYNTQIVALGVDTYLKMLLHDNFVVSFMSLLHLAELSTILKHCDIRSYFAIARPQGSGSVQSG